MVMSIDGSIGGVPIPTIVAHARFDVTALLQAVPLAVAVVFCCEERPQNSCMGEWVAVDEA